MRVWVPHDRPGTHMSSPRDNFSYVFEVGEDRRGPFNGRVTGGFGECVLGSAPELSWTEYTPAAWKLYARVELKATERQTAVAGISFIIDRGLMTVLSSGDYVYLAALPLLGISIVRNGLLIAAAGSAPTLTRIPLGSEVSLTFPEPAEVRIVLGGGERYRPENFAVRPVAVSVVGEPSRACWRGRPRVGRYDVLVDRGLHLGEPRVSMELSKICPETAAHTSAQLMDRDGYQVAER